MNASTVQRPRHAAVRTAGALCALLLLLSSTAPGVRADGLPQAITFGAAPTGVVVRGTGFSVSASASSLLPVTYTTLTSLVCTVDSSTGALTLLAAGTCTIAADQAGQDPDWLAAPQVTQDVSVGQGSQTISFTSTAPGAAVVGGATYAPTASATSGLLVTLTIDVSASSVCSISGADVSFIGTGTCVIDADQGGDANYTPATQVQQSFAVGPASLNSQTISFTSTAPSAAVVGGATYTPSATATSGLPVALTIDISASSVCAISGGGVVSFTGAGTCLIDANQAGDGTWAPAPQVTQSFAIGLAVTPPPGTFPTLTVTADSKSRPFGVANPAFTAVISGFVNGQTLLTSGVTGSPACTTTATLLSPAGTYPITCSSGTLASAAYSFVFEPGTLTVVRGASSVTLSTTTTVFETSSPATYTATVEPGVTATIPSGNLLFMIDGVAKPAVALDASGRGSVSVTWTTPGVKSVAVSYAGDGSFAASGTASAAPRVVANTARATGVGVSATTFYPIVDSWRDTVTARGTRGERLSLVIEVKNARGRLVRGYSAGPAAGAYAWTWNGRTSKGVLVPAGRYTIVQTLTDPYGSRPRRTVTSRVAVSLQKIKWTTKTITAGPGPRCFQLSSGDGVGSYSCSSTAPLRLAGGAGHWPGVGYQFQLPPATGYRSIRIELLGTYSGRRPTVGLHDWTLGSAWGQLYRVGWRRTAITPTASAWSGVTIADPGRFISGRSVRAYVDGGGRLAGAFAFEIARVRLVVSVGTLR